MLLLASVPGKIYTSGKTTMVKIKGQGKEKNNKHYDINTAPLAPSSPDSI